MLTPARRRLAGPAGQTAIAGLPGVGGSYALPFLVVLSSQFSHIFLPRRRSVALFQFELVYRHGGTIERRPGANRFEKQRTASAIRAIHAGASPCGEYRHEAPTLCVLL